MPDRLFFPLLALVVVAMIALAVVWPQGLGRPSPPPFGHALPAMGSPVATVKPPPSSPLADAASDHP
jgi:hypothetical protein